jgi:hypothetical protein
MFSTINGMGVKHIAIFSVIFLLAMTISYAQSCAEMVNFNTLVCGGAPDSALGTGAVDICNVCYPCGADDGVCPEDFYADGSGRGSCRFCQDPDCLVTIDGNVEDSEGFGVEGASIIALYEPDIKETVGVTDGVGYYTADVRSGYIKLYVSFEDFDSRIIDVDIPRETGVVATVNFAGANAIEPGSCDASCTDNFGNRCKASCNGINGCAFDVIDGPSGQVSASLLCDDKIVGSRAFLPGSDTEYVLCCQGNEVFSTDDNRIDASSPASGQLVTGADDLVTFTQRVRSAGERVNLQVVVWGSDE